MEVDAHRLDDGIGDAWLEIVESALQAVAQPVEHLRIHAGVDMLRRQAQRRVVLRQLVNLIRNEAGIDPQHGVDHAALHGGIDFRIGDIDQNETQGFRRFGIEPLGDHLHALQILELADRLAAHQVGGADQRHHAVIGALLLEFRLEVLGGEFVDHLDRGQPVARHDEGLLEHLGQFEAARFVGDQAVGVVGNPRAHGLEPVLGAVQGAAGIFLDGQPIVGGLFQPFETGLPDGRHHRSRRRRVGELDLDRVTGRRDLRFGSRVLVIKPLGNGIGGIRRTADADQHAQGND